MSGLKELLIAIFLILSGSLLAQNMQLISYAASNGIEYKAGTRIYFGNGSNPDKSFNHILMNAPTVNIRNNLSSTWTGQFMEVKRIRQSGSKRAGYRVYLICKNKGSVNYWIDIERAIDSGEVVNPGF